jgi:hypothetical protein
MPRRKGFPMPSLSDLYEEGEQLERGLEVGFEPLVGGGLIAAIERLASKVGASDDGGWEQQLEAALSSVPEIQSGTTDGIKQAIRLCELRRNNVEAA